MPQEGLTVLARIRTTLPTHPSTGARALGFTSKGRPVWPVRGGAPDGGGDSGGGDSGGDSGGDAGTGQADSGTGDATADSSDTDAGQADSGQDSQDGTGEVARLRREAANYRTQLREAQAAQQQQLDAIAKALGLKDGDDAPDPAQLTEQLTASQAEARQARVELAVFRGAAAHSGDPAALLDSRSFLTSVAQLDPADAGFDKAVSDAIKAAVDGNPKLKTVQAAGASGADHAGGSGERRNNNGKPLPLHEAVAASYGT